MTVKIPIIVLEPQRSPLERIIERLKGFEGTPLTPATQSYLDCIAVEARRLHRAGQLADIEFNQVWATIRSVQHAIDDAGMRAGR